MTERARVAIGAAIINEEREILLVREGQTWKLPGGKPELGETDAECLQRETAEELSVARLDNLRPFGSVSGITPNVGDRIEVRLYLAEIAAPVIPSGEIDEARWFRAPITIGLNDLTRIIISTLQDSKVL